MVEILRRWSPIADALHVGSANTAIAYARLSVDPLSVVMVRGVPCIETSVLEEWRARRNGGVMRDGSSLERIDGAKAIAKRVGCAESTVLRLASLPVDPLPLYGRKRSRWTYETAVRDWLARRTIPFQAMRAGRSDADERSARVSR